MPSPEQQLAGMLHNLEERTGKDLGAWLLLVEATGLTKHGELVDHLKTEHGVTHGYANLIASEHLKEATVGYKDVVAAQYAGPKSALRPIYDTLIGVVERFGEDVEIAPKKTYVSIRRKRQFALIQPSTSTRVDLGIRLDDVEPNTRLERAGSFNQMVSHRVRLEDPIEVDAEVKGWLHQAYEQA